MHAGYRMVGTMFVNLSPAIPVVPQTPNSPHSRVGNIKYIKKE